MSPSQLRDPGRAGSRTAGPDGTCEESRLPSCPYRRRHPGGKAFSCRDSGQFVPSRVGSAVDPPQDDEIGTRAPPRVRSLENLVDRLRFGLGAPRPSTGSGPAVEPGSASPTPELRSRAIIARDFPLHLTGAASIVDRWLGCARWCTVAPCALIYDRYGRRRTRDRRARRSHGRPLRVGTDHTGGAQHGSTSSRPFLASGSPSRVPDRADHRHRTDRPVRSNQRNRRSSAPARN